MSDGSLCERGDIRLRPLVNGQLDRSRFVDIMHFDDIFGPFARIGKSLGSSPAYSSTGYGKISQLMSGIEPGTYVVTSVSCRMDKRRDSMGWDSGSGFATSANVVPVFGQNTIVIGKGEIVDAGVIEMVQIERAGIFRSAKAMLVGTEAPEAFKAVIRQQLPGLYPDIRFTKFSAQTFGH
jgi:hypothetical protein